MRERNCLNCINFGKPEMQYLCDNCMEDESYPTILKHHKFKDKDNFKIKEAKE